MSGDRLDATAVGAHGRAPDPLGMAAAAMASAVASGLALITATVLGVRALRPAPGAAVDVGAPADLGAPLYLLFLGTLGGIVLAGIVAWRLLAGLGSTYRRGALAVVSAFATVLFMLICLPVDRLLGPPGLAGLLVLSGVAAVVLARRARRAGLGA